MRWRWPAPPDSETVTGRFAPSPTGDLHVGNLRTALVAWLLARVGGGRFVLRVEDLDRATSSLDHERSQLADLAALGLDWDNDEHGPVWRQSDRFPAYDEAIDRLAPPAGSPTSATAPVARSATAVRAPHAGDLEGGYPGTCRHLTGRERAERRRTRPPALRFRSDHATIVVDDIIAGRRPSPVDDVVLRRNDGVPAYNLAVVVDDAAQGVDQVVRGDDLLAVTGSQIALQRALDLPTPRYGHVPLVLGPAGERLAKRDGAVTLAGLERPRRDGRRRAPGAGHDARPPAARAGRRRGAARRCRPGLAAAARAGRSRHAVSSARRGDQPLRQQEVPRSEGRPLVDSGGDAGSPPTRSRGHAPRARQSYCRQPHRRGSDAAPRRLLGHGGPVRRARRDTTAAPTTGAPATTTALTAAPTTAARPTTTAARPTTTAAPTTTVAPTTTLPATTTTLVSPAIVAVGAPEAGFVAVGTHSGSDTARIQQRLLDLGFWLSAVDGDYGYDHQPGGDGVPEVQRARPQRPRRPGAPPTR